MNKRVFSIDLIRGIGIIAVVICHQIGLLHPDQSKIWFVICNVTLLIFAMGFTKGFSLKKYFDKQDDRKILRYSFDSIKPVLLSYLLASYVFDIAINKITDKSEIFNHIINFNACAPFYFIEFFIKLSLWAPLIYFVFVKIYEKEGAIRYIYICVFLIFTWLIGYFSIDKLDIFGQSYLFVYSVGMLCSIIDWSKVNSALIWSASILLFLIGCYLGHRFIFSRFAGNTNYAELIDFIDPKLQLNPPNLSVILYSFGIIAMVYCVSGLVENRKVIEIPFKVLAILGQYSLDIFLWHIFVQSILNNTVKDKLDNLWLRGLIYYPAMLAIPVLCRILLNHFKKKIYDYKCRGTSNA